MPLLVLFLVTILIVSSQSIEAQPKTNLTAQPKTNLTAQPKTNLTALGYSCSESAIQPADPVEMLQEGPNSAFYVEKETFQCTYFPPGFRLPFFQDVMIFVGLGQAGGRNPVICSRSVEGNITECIQHPITSSIGNLTLTQCTERPIEHPIGGAGPLQSGTFFGYYSDTHVYKCLGNDHIPRIKIVTFFITPAAGAFEIVFIENEITPIASAKVETEDFRFIPIPVR
jgi:hypothetical protein